MNYKEVTEVVKAIMLEKPESVEQEDRVVLTGEITNVEMSKSSFGDKGITMSFSIQTESMGYVRVVGPLDIYKAFKIGDRVTVDIR
jgi:hypothetical protein